MNQSKGFTLLEILIALTIFAILAAITSSILYHTFSIRARVADLADRTNTLQLAISLIQQDTLQTVERPIRSDDQQVFPAFIGQTSYLELTRDGNANPQSLEKRSTLKRVALVCNGQTLVRRTWNTLDSIDKKKFEDKVLLDELTQCNFKYLNQTLQLLEQWRDQAITQSQRKEPLPKAIQVNVTFKNWGEMNLLFIIPGAVYATN